MTARAVVLGLLLTAIICPWIHYAELMGRMHTALANTSIPVGAFTGLAVLTALSLLLGRRAKALRLSQSELITVYVMTTVSTVVASAGGVHFLVPTILAPRYFATAENRWAELFGGYLKPWLSPTDEKAINGFFRGYQPVPVQAWIVPFLAWLSFIAVFLFGMICIGALLRRQWVDRERLTFPTVYLPLETTREDGGLFRNRVFWIGFTLPMVIGALNSLNLNVPTIPGMKVRPIDLSPFFTDRPWNGIGYTPISFYPFIIGIGFLLSTEVLLSAWFFFWFTRFENVFGVAAGFREPGASGAAARFPFIGYQGAGAFLAITVVALWLARPHLRECFRAAINRRYPVDDSREPLPYRWAVWGLLGCLLFLSGFCSAAGMSFWLAFGFLLLIYVYITAAVRIRAEAGNAWLMGPDIDPHRLILTATGSGAISPVNLTVMAYLRFVSNYDLRQLSMPHQMDAFKMAGQVGLNQRRLVGALVLAIVLGTTVAFWSALGVWYWYGAAAKCDPWRTMMGQQPWTMLQDSLRNVTTTDWPGMAAAGVGFGVTVGLTLLRMRYLWWPLHPIGYALANTNTMNTMWMPFFLAWLAKTMVLRYGGMSLYRRSLPFFLGLIFGDFINGALWTTLGIFTGISAYPVNW
ncbi:MAG: hypothetical protein QHJ73_08050 [Armatimonadota bacterium]|nr:hypothetical protein [Armatimonadota bacterium]